jgi:hypothetical protein
MNMISFSEAATTGSSKYIKVFKSNKVKSNHSQYNELKIKTSKIQIGRISFTTGNKFYYYEPPTNTTRPVLIDGDLEILKKKVVNRRDG